MWRFELPGLGSTTLETLTEAGGEFGHSRHPGSPNGQFVRSFGRRTGCGFVEYAVLCEFG